MTCRRLEESMRFLVLSSLLFLFACAPAVHEYDFRVSGTTQQWSGNYSLQDGAGKMISGTVQDALPASYTLRGRVVSLIAQKRAKEGTLKVEVFRKVSIP